MTTEQHDDRQDEPVRVVIIGYGLAGAVFHAPLVASTPGMTVAGIVTGNPERQQDAVRTYPQAAVLPRADTIWEHPERYDLVVVATPNRSHVPLALSAIDAGLPVVVDKPLAVSVPRGQELIAAAEKQGSLLTVFQNRRWDGDFLTVRALLAQEVLGPLVRYESRFERYRPAPKPGSWRELADPEEGGGLLFDLGSHLIDQAMVLFGQPTKVYAEVEVRRPGGIIDDDTFVALEFSGGFRAHLWMNTVVRSLHPRFHVSGLQGSYVKYGLDPQETALKSGMRPGDDRWGLESRESWGELSTSLGALHTDGRLETLPGRYDAFYRQVRAALVDGAPLPVQPRDSLATLEVIEAARQSAHEGRVVDLAINLP